MTRATTIASAYIALCRAQDCDSSMVRISFLQSAAADLRVADLDDLAGQIDAVADRVACCGDDSAVPAVMRRLIEIEAETRRAFQDTAPKPC